MVLSDRFLRVGIVDKLLFNHDACSNVSCLLFRKDAEEAIQSLNRTTIGNQTVRLSWGRSIGSKQVKLCLGGYSL